MRTIAIASAIALTALAGCGSDEAVPTNSAATVEKPTSLKERDPQAYHDNIGSAMAEIPGPLRQEFNTLLVCTVRAGTAAGAAPKVDAALIRELTAKLKTTPDAGKLCQG